MEKKSNLFAGLWITAIFMIILFGLLFSCTTNHYFSINAEEMTNPSIEYKDSTNMQKLW